MNTPSFSFEFFPPKTDKGIENLKTVRESLAELKPEFFSVTYGAGGSTQDCTLSTVIDIQQHSGIDTAPHLSCIGSSQKQIRELLDIFKNNDIKRIVALRGDLPSGMMDIGEFKYANELVEFIRAEKGDYFTIEVAAYPEMHPQATNFQSDLMNFAKKVSAGADSAITQYFYNADAYFRFVDSCAHIGIDTPIIPGIMPITNITQLARFSDATGAEIPRWLRKRLEGYGEDLDSIQKLGLDFVTEMSDKLLAGGAPGLHFYSMNRVEPSLSIWNNLGLSER
ncbi:MAG: 5,10-methylenetetrahydrofolate reductase (EC [uncultured Thiotrichaceae bacterium]|uniref:Methylenetetrahydrofolate reductase n=1 Tax=uncultured Thiotrichaceae bacterium TaxID=298394 RepID=A0A6S6S1Q2_9GAMM|nr:MAG: 5,10-methylenetetrahydrofolate reductase (EC [uncultured Thiotrichaceae bacterium]